MTGYEKGSVSKKNVHGQKANYKRGTPNLASNQSFLTGGRWPGCFLDFPDKHRPRLSMSPGGNNVRRSSPLGGQLYGAGLDLHDTFGRGGVFLPKRTTGAVG
jgi:hypothetical protein